MQTHAAMPSPGGPYGVDPLHPGWHPQVSPLAPPSAPGPGRQGDHLPPGYGQAPVPPENPVAAPSVPGPRRPDDHLPPGYGQAPVTGGEYRHPQEFPVQHTPPRRPAQPQPPQAQLDEEEVEEQKRAALWWADVRKQVAWRSKRLNSGHTAEAHNRFGRREALGPHAVMLFFVSEAATEPLGYQLHTAYRLWPDSPEAEDLPALLADLTDVATDNIARVAKSRRQWHPLGPEGSMVNGGDMSLPPHAIYVGVGVSTLDSDQGRWHQVAQTLQDAAARGTYMSPFNLKGQCYLRLTDGTNMYIDRNPQARLGDDGIRSSKPLDPERPLFHNPYADLTEQGDEATREVWRQLGGLHNTLTTHLLPRRSA